VSDRFDVIIGARDEASPVLRKFQDNLRHTETGAERVNRSLIGMADKAKWAFAGISAAIVGATKVFADFDREMANVSTMLRGEAIQYMDDYRIAVRDMSVEFGEATGTLSKGLYDILSAGIDASEAIDVLDVAARTAAAGMTDTGTAADALTTMINAFGMEASDAERVADSLFTAVFGGKTTFDELAGAVGRVAPVAAMANVSMEEMNAALSTLTRAGLSTDEAVTALRAVILAYISPSQQAAEAAAELGINLSAATLDSIGLAGAMEQVTGLTAEQSGAIFGNVRALLAAAGITQDLTGFQEDLAAQYDSAGAMAEAQAKATDNLAHQLDRLRMAGMDVVRGFGEALAPAISEIVERLQAVAQTIRDMDPEQKQMIANMALMAAQILGVIVVVGYTVKALSGLATMFGIASAAAAPWILAIVGIGLALAALVIFWPEIKAFFENWGQAIKDNFPIIEEFIERTREMRDEIREALTDVGIPEPIADPMAQWAAPRQAVYRYIAEFIQYLTENDPATIWEDIVARIEEADARLEAIGVGEEFARRVNPISQAVLSIKDVLESFGVDFDGIVENMRGQWGKFQELFTIEDALEGLSHQWETIKDSLNIGGFIEWFQDKWRGLAGHFNIEDAIAGLEHQWESIRQVFDIENLTEWLRTKWNEIREAFNLDGVRKYLSDEWERLRGIFTWYELRRHARETWNRITDALHFDRVRDALQRGWDRLKWVFSISELRTRARDTWNSITEVLSFDRARDALERGWERLGGIFTWRTIQAAVRDAWSKIVEVLRLEDAHKLLSSQWEKFTEIFTIGKITQAVKEAWDGFLTLFDLKDTGAGLSVQWATIKEAFNIDALRTWFADQWSGFLELIDLEHALLGIEHQWQALKEKFDFSHIGEWFADQWKGLTGLFSIEDALAGIQYQWNTIKDIFTVEGLREAVKEAWNKITEALSLEGIRESLQKAWAGIEKIFVPFGLPEGWTRFEEFWQSMVEVWDTVLEAWEGFKARLIDFILPEWMQSLLRFFGVDLPQEAEKGRESVGGAFDEIIDDGIKLTGAMDSVVNEVETSFSLMDIVTPFSNAYHTIRDNIFSGESAWEIGKNFIQYFMGALRELPQMIRDWWDELNKVWESLPPPPPPPGFEHWPGVPPEMHSSSPGTDQLSRILNLNQMYAGGAGDIPLAQIERTSYAMEELADKTDKASGSFLDFVYVAADLARIAAGLEPVYSDVTKSIVDADEAQKEATRTMDEYLDRSKELQQELPQLTEEQRTLREEIGVSAEVVREYINALQEITEIGKQTTQTLEGIAESARFDVLMQQVDQLTKEIIRAQQQFETAKDRIREIAEERADAIRALAEEYPELWEQANEQIEAIERARIDATLAENERYFYTISEIAQKYGMEYEEVLHNIIQNLLEMGEIGEQVAIQIARAHMATAQSMFEQYQMVRELIRQMEGKATTPGPVGMPPGTGYGWYTSVPPEERVNSYQHGGFVPQTGLAMLHAGEYVVPSHQTTNMGSTYNITMHITADGADTEKLARDIWENLEYEARRRGGTILGN